MAYDHQDLRAGGHAPPLASNGRRTSRPIFTSRRRRRRRTSGPLPALALLSLLLMAGAGYWAWKKLVVAPDTVPTVALDPIGAAPPPDSALPPEAEAPAESLPALDASDERVRRMAATLSSHPRVASWLMTDGLIRRIVIVTASVANGISPAEHLPFLRPPGDLTTRRVGERTLIDPSSFRRYDALVAAFLSLDVEGSARTFHRIEPLLDEAYQDLGLDDRRFREVLGDAVERLTSFELPSGPVAVVPDGALFAYADPRLEEAPPANKLLVRLGPENARRVQERLAALAEAIGIEPR